MFTRNNFYSYLHQHLSATEHHPFRLMSFQPDGAREFENMLPWKAPDSKMPARYVGNIAMFDTEPVDLNYWQHWIDYNPKALPKSYFTGYKACPTFYKSLDPTNFVFHYFSGLYNPIIAHSERNSADVNIFTDNHFHPVYYFYHGLVAREWFRHWKHYNMPKNENAMRLGLYARDAGGSREYRLDLLRKLLPFKDQVYFRLQPELFDQFEVKAKDLMKQWTFNNQAIGADYSAKIVVEDSANFQIQIVPETLFDTQKTHLTEKVFKPIVMRQPFIIAGPPRSLEYLRDYGFRTFDGLWDEGYDKETDAESRMHRLQAVFEYLTNLNPAAFKRVMDRAQNVIDWNHKRFFSHEFEDQILLEIQNNFKSAFVARNDEFYTMPGGTWFYHTQRLVNSGNKLSKHTKTLNAKLIAYLNENGESTVAKEILKKYPNLL